MSKLTSAQRECLRIAALQGAAFPVSMQKRMGGGYRRMVDRLAAAGYLSLIPPYHILQKGRAILAESHPSPSIQRGEGK